MQQNSAHTEVKALPPRVPPVPDPVRSRERPRPRLPPLRLQPLMTEPPLRASLRAVAGIAFLVLGALKVSVAQFDMEVLGAHLQLPSGPSGFAQFLAAAGAPLPHLSSYLVLATELGCGLGLLLGIFVPTAKLFTRLFAFPLAFDMGVALGVVGIRNVSGHPVMMQGLPVMHQAWRFPLELLLLGCLIYFMLKPLLDPSSHRFRLLAAPLFGARSTSVRALVPQALPAPEAAAERDARESTPARARSQYH